MAQRVEDEQLPDGTTGGEGENVVADGRMGADEGEGGVEFCAGVGEVDGEGVGEGLDD